MKKVLYLFILCFLMLSLSSCHKCQYGEWSVTKETTCASTGLRVRTCLECGEIEEEKIAINPSAHKFGSWKEVDEATCVSKGSEERKCQYCGKTEERSTSIDSTAHTYSAATCLNPKKCINCGRTSGSALGHNNVNGKCSRCGITMETTFEMLRNHIKAEGEYDYEDNEYSLIIYNQYPTTTQLVYCVSSNTIQINTLHSGSGVSSMSTLTLNKSLSGLYEYQYIDTYDYYMEGQILSGIFDGEVLNYTYTNVYSSSLKETVMKLSGSLVSMGLSTFSLYCIIADLDITVEDLGFDNFDKD